MSKGPSKLEQEMGDNPERQFGKRVVNSIFPIPKVSAIVDQTEKLQNAFMIDISLLEPDPNNPRIVFDEEELENLAASITMFGVQIPLAIRKHETAGRWYITEGERRWRASKIAGKTHAPCVVTDIASKDILLLQLHLNCQHIEYGPIELGRSYARLMAEHKWKEREAAAALKKSQSFVHKVKVVSELPEELQKQILADKAPLYIAYKIAVKYNKEQETSNKPKPVPRQTSIRYNTPSGRVDLVVKIPNATDANAEVVLLEALEQCRAQQRQPEVFSQEAA